MVVKRNYLTFIFLICIFVSNAFAIEKGSKTKVNLWKLGVPVFLPGAEGSFDETAVKDPSIVFYKNAWHLFYTARGKDEYTTGYVSAKDLDSLKTATRFELEQIRGKTRYGCAPQVFYFELQKKWYLIFQNRDSNYQPAFSTTETISKPESWSTAQVLIQKDKSSKWIDFWVIADNTKVYLFYTEAHQGVVVRSTSFNEFPNGWSEGVNVFDDVHEAVHIYKAINKNEFHMIYELNTDGIRSFGLATSNHLSGPWEKVTDNYASGNQLKYFGNSIPWTEMVSHGEVIRTGYNQFMEYDPENCSWLIQGILKNELNVDYPDLPWKLGIIQSVQ